MQASALGVHECWDSSTVIINQLSVALLLAYVSIPLDLWEVESPRAFPTADFRPWVWMHWGRPMHAGESTFLPGAATKIT